ncbi:MAG: hypothetical protein ACD_58C00146G0004 [uncultured bacterium]|nr:MAG: hypothetical protein ACD_58C00146G0004 [uncultured bacterium]
MTKCSIGIMAYNEEKNIGKILKALINQVVDKVKIAEIVVVSSGSTDKTEKIVKGFIKIDQRVKLISQPKRLGKVKAINDYLKTVKYPIIVMESADTIPQSDAIEKICLPLINDKKVGVVGAHPVPTNNVETLMGFINFMQWELHHRMSLKSAKCGEMIAMRNMLKKIPQDLIIDDAYIERYYQLRGYLVAYAGDAIIKNKGPETIKDFIRRRRNLATGFIQLKKKYNYVPPTNNIFWLVGETLKITGFNAKKIIWAKIGFLLNSYAGTLGWYDYYVKKKCNAVWEMAKTSKEIN